MHAFSKLFRGFYQQCGFAVSSLRAVLIGLQTSREGGHVMVNWWSCGIHMTQTTLKSILTNLVTSRLISIGLFTLNLGYSYMTPKIELPKNHFSGHFR